MGLAGAIIVVSQIITQYFSSFHSTKNISVELEQIRLDQEKYFAKKDEVEKVSLKIDSLKKDLSEMNNKIKYIKRYVSNDHAMGLSSSLNSKHKADDKWPL